MPPKRALELMLTGRRVQADRVGDASASGALAALHPLLSVLVQTDEAREALATFADGRPPRFTGR